MLGADCSSIAASPRFNEVASFVANIDGIGYELPAIICFHVNCSKARRDEPGELQHAVA